MNVTWSRNNTQQEDKKKNANIQKKKQSWRGAIRANGNGEVES